MTSKSYLNYILTCWTLKRTISTPGGSSRIIGHVLVAEIPLDYRVYFPGGGNTTETVVSTSTGTPFINVGSYRHCSTTARVFVECCQSLRRLFRGRKYLMLGCFSVRIVKDNFSAFVLSVRNKNILGKRMSMFDMNQQRRNQCSVVCLSAHISAPTDGHVFSCSDRIAYRSSPIII